MPTQVALIILSGRLRSQRHHNHADRYLRARIREMIFTERKNFCVEFSRPIHFLKVFTWYYRIKALIEKIIVFSQYLRFLDIIAEILNRTCQIPCLRYDGCVPSNQRKVIETQFRDSGNRKPLLITAGAGGVDLNITTTSIVIQTEAWWNESVEWQATCRVYRQGQTKQVHAVRLQGGNSRIDNILINTNIRKSEVNRV